MPEEGWFIEVDFVPAGDEVQGSEDTHQDWHCKSYDRGTAGLLLQDVEGGFDLLFIPYSAIRSVGISPSPGGVRG